MRKLESKQTLGGNKWLELQEHTYNDGTKYTVVHESRCNGNIVIILPYKVDDKLGLQYLVRNEMTPPWSLTELVPSSVSGGIDSLGDNPLKTALKELKEECGYLASESNVIPLGTSYGVKCADTIYHIFAVDVTSVAEIPPSAPDTFESEAQNEWISASDYDKIVSVKDPLWSIAYVRHAMHLLKNYS